MDRVLFFMLMLLVLSFSMLVTTIAYISLIKGYAVRAEIDQVNSVTISGRLVFMYQGPLKAVDIGISEIFILPGNLIVVELAPQPLDNVVINYDCENHTLTLKNLLISSLAVAGTNVYSGMTRLQNLTLTNVTLDATNLTLYIPSEALRFALIDFGAEKVRVAKVSMDLRMLGCNKDNELVIDGVMRTIRVSALYIELDATVVLDMSGIRANANIAVLLTGITTIVSSLLATMYIMLRSYELR